MYKNTIDISLPLDWDEAFFNDTSSVDERDNLSPSEALILSIQNMGRLDLPYISRLTGLSVDDVIALLSEQGQIYQNPRTWGKDPCKGWETYEEYLSGNILLKFKEAKREALSYPRFSRNMEALKAVMPKGTDPEDVYITLGSPWVPTHIIDEFIDYLFEGRGYAAYASSSIYHVKHDEYQWQIPYKGRYGRATAAVHTYGTRRLSALELLEMTLNMKTAAVYDEVHSLTTRSGTARVLNEEETLLAVQKQKLLIDKFQGWVFKDVDRRAELMDIYETLYGSTKVRHFNGSYLTFPGMSPDVELYPYQKDAVARILFTPNTLLAHEVGSGKTYVMIAAAMELKRMGVSSKNMFVVPNSIVGQWKEIFTRLYPDADILCVDPKSFVPAKRADVLESIRDREYDGIIIAYSCYEQIPISRKYYRESLGDELIRLRQQAAQDKDATSSVSARIKRIQRKLDKLSRDPNGQDSELICFDELGITRLFVDEAHNFKNIPVETKANLIRGLSNNGSKKCQTMLDKVRIVQRMNNGGGIVMATGTPITNSITDIYVMQVYLQSGELALMDLQSFDHWAGMFAERITDFEIDVDTNSYKLVSRYGRFHNLPVLTSMISSFADFHKAGKMDGIPAFDGYTDIPVAKTRVFSRFLEEISQRADDVRHRRVDRRKDNLLKITTDGRKGALDLRLVDEELYQISGSSKVQTCANKVFEIYERTKDERGVQAVFCDISTPKPGFNMYDELKFRLIKRGIPEDEIVFIHDATTEAKRSSMMKSVRRGDTRVLIGSTFKLGIGVNIQDRLVALHHLDVPWRPGDLTQRNGRILRQGNLCEKVYIYRYYTAGSFDAYSWQLLETKQRFIDDLLSGTVDDREAEDVSDTALSYGEIKALSVGNPLLKKRCQLSNELQRYQTLQRKASEAARNLHESLEDTESLLREYSSRTRANLEDYKNYLALKPGKTTNKKILRKQRKDLRSQLDKALREFYYRPRERELFDYNGFKVILPANMTEEKPYIYLQGKSRYMVGMGNTEQGNLSRIDHFLESFEKRIGKLEDAMKEKENEIRNIEKELMRTEGYAERIADLRKELAEVDELLGVKKNGKK